MRSAGTFVTILAVGVLIVLIYQWSGDSILVLIMCLITLFALLALWDRKPWAAIDDGDADDETGDDGSWLDRDQGGIEAGAGDTQASTDGRPAEAVRSEHTGRDGEPDRGSDQSATGQEPEPARRPEQVEFWRSRFDIRPTEEGVTGLAIGQREPQLWPWTDITSAHLDWSQAIARDDVVEERLSVHLGVATSDGDADAPVDGADPPVAQLMLGPAQHPQAVVDSIHNGQRMARIMRSRYHSLSPAERTRQLTDALSPAPVALTKHVRSPELLYQEARRVLLSNRALRRISRDADADQVMTAFEQILDAHQAEEVSDAEVGPLAAAADNNDIDSVYRIGGAIAEARGYRLAFIHHGGEDHLLGLLTLDDAEEWDGQTIGSGLTSLSLVPPIYV